MQRNLAKVLAVVMAASILTGVPALTAYAEETDAVNETVTEQEATTAQDQKTTDQTEGEQPETETISETKIEEDGSTEMAGAGISVILSEYYSKNKDSRNKILKLLEPEKETETTKAEKETTEKKTTEKETTKKEEKKEEETTKKEPEQHEQYFKNLAIATVGDYTYVNVRAKAGTDAEIIGKIYGNGGATILDQKNGWYHVKSGGIKGYVSSDYFITGAEAEKYALEMGYVLASVDVPALNLRKGKSTETDIVGSLVMGSTYVVLEISNGWAKLAVDESAIGWVSMDYVTVRAALETAIAPNEEPESEEPETTEATTQQTTQQPTTTQKPTQQTTTKKPAAQTQNNTAASAKASEIIAYAMQFLGNPYVYGGSSLTNGTDCSGFTMSVYGHFGYSLNRSSRDQVHNGRAVSLDALQPGDLVFYAYGGVIGHVAIYIGNGQIIHASSPSTGIMISKLNYGTAPCAARRILN